MIPLALIAFAAGVALGRWRSIAQRDELARDIDTERANGERTRAALRKAIGERDDARQAATEWSVRSARFEQVARQLDLENARRGWLRTKASA